MSSKVFSAAAIGLDSELIEIEVDSYLAGLHRFMTVGLPDQAVKESQDRVGSAIRNSGLIPPQKCGRITVNLAPADLRKEGPIYDLPIALGFLLATKQASFDSRGRLFIGELSLDGRIRPAKGVLSMAILAKEKGFREICVPKGNAPEASIISGIRITPASNLKSLLEHLEGSQIIEAFPTADPRDFFHHKACLLDMKDIRGQEHAKRALEIAAAGAHNILLSGPPGSGKTLLAKTLPSILPELDTDEAIEITKIFSASGKLPPGESLIASRQFRSPHHSASAVSLVGGGTFPRPGEISLAHRGVLFLDEFPEFSRNVLENLRQPLENGMITVSRAQGTLDFPARFTLVAAMNPCPCGNATDPERHCTCTPTAIARYQSRISGPILDRIDLQIDVPRIRFEKLSEDGTGERSETIRARVESARKRQKERFGDSGTIVNSEMGSQEIKEHCRLDPDSVDLMRKAVSRFRLSARSYFRVIKVARTIADLSDAENIGCRHVAEAIQYRFPS